MRNLSLTETQKYDAAVISVIGFYLLALFFSYGYLQADEHFQIIEFGYYFIGENQPSELAWEFESKIRPSLQPIIAAGAIHLNALFDEGDIYSLTLILRFLTMILSLAVLLKFANSQRKKFEYIGTYWYYFLSLGLWFILFFSFRFSSETWSGLLCLLAITFYFEKRSFWWIGILFGLSFLFRFQTAFLSFGFLLNLLIFKEINVKQILQLIVSFTLIFSLGVLLDSWFYSEFTITAWNYFEFNILTDGATNFGYLPWYYYVLFLFKKPFVVLGVLLLITLILNLRYKYKDPIIWGVFFFLIFHSIVPHKESRFLIPVAFLAPYLLFNALKIVRNGRIRFGILAFVAVLNVVPMTVVALKSAGPGYVYLGKYLNEKFDGKKVIIYSFPYSNPFYHWDQKIKNHYNYNEFDVVFVRDQYDLEGKLLKWDLGFQSGYDTTNYVQLLTVREEEHAGFLASPQYEKMQPKYICSSHPDWILKLLRLYNGFEYFEVVHLYQIDPKTIELLK